ncbi:MAG: sugar O-acetyltransferase [Cytophagales bacterium]|nr:sugar O-acetyltransferase [Bernardetiaceae bacterium]MDW8204434.1 sugar O-acetyltransferase [Cytophagales bacterium]
MTVHKADAEITEMLADVFSLGYNFTTEALPKHMDMNPSEILNKLRGGATIHPHSPEFAFINQIVPQTHRLIAQLNNLSDSNDIRACLSEITGSEIDASTVIFPPFYTNFGRLIRIGKGVFINHACSFLDIGGITIEDEVMIAPRVNLTTENHPLNPNERRTLLTAPIVIKRRAWIGAGATILPGVTIGENSVVAAGAVVTKDVPANTVVAGVPAKPVKRIDE